MRIVLFFLCCACSVVFAAPCHVILVRHGETEALAHNVYCEDSCLNQKGMRQAQEVVQKLRGVHIDALYSSPIRRAVQTATPLSTDRSLPIQTDERLKERSHGSLEGHPVSDVVGHALFDRYYNPKKQEDLSIKLVPDAESFKESTARFSECVQEIASHHPGQTVVIFSHSGLMKGLMILLTKRFDQPSIPNGSILHVMAEQSSLVPVTESKE